MIEVKNYPREMSVIGRIFNIQHFCVDDGPGIRTTVFFKGCPLRCAWCHNPESHTTEKDIMFRPELCCGCGVCVSHCEIGNHSIIENIHKYDRSQCILCGNCVAYCPTHALEMIGKNVTVEDIMTEVLVDRVFYHTSGGGITLSGGEPTAQPRFAEALLAMCKNEGLHTCMETCAWCSSEIMERLNPLVDLFLIDWKISDDHLHRHYTGVSNQPILQNLSLLSKRKASVVLRCPLIPDVNITTTHFDGIVSLVNCFPNIMRIDLEPYHPMGISKNEALGKRSLYENTAFLDKIPVNKARDYLQDRVSIPVLISGK